MCEFIIPEDLKKFKYMYDENNGLMELIKMAKSTGTFDT